MLQRGLRRARGARLARSCARRGLAATSSRDARELAKFDGLDWDGPEGRALAEMHATRVGALRQHVAQRYGGELGALRVLDVGCGGGLLAHSLVHELGAGRVVAVDAVAQNVAATAARVGASPRFEGRCATAEQVLAEEGPGAFDIVLSLEVVEHVNRPDLFLETLGRLAKQGVVLSTINRTLKSFALAIVAAEYVTGKVPVGTHDWAKFVTPEEVGRALHPLGLHTDQVVGMVYNPLSGKWAQSACDVDVNYMLFASR
jgi:2-polyprenyl-6-hydroxyphenyl methylase/3-demethylubiquinone-9 3-methyltransferase